MTDSLTRICLLAVVPILRGSMCVRCLSLFAFCCGGRKRANCRNSVLWRQESAEAFLQLSPAVVKLQRRWCALISAGTVRLAAVLESEGACMWQVSKPHRQRDKGTEGESRCKSEVREYTAVTALGHGALFALAVGRLAVWPETRVGSVLECRRLP